ncbi:unnamed protein product [Mytilus coruscus]|uniref:Reverse transcriptase domain-containing protein n=1 Tax=Mytilus coruscus TaxID=42192 RepID=A0A6J7ZVV1_MYTCO|nr:unnamed protein product [Mytilus coruscus]
MQLSPLGLAEKKMPGTYRMIHHLSFPEGSSINDNIPQDKCSVQYASIHDAIELIKTVGRKSFCAKTDISSAFRIINIKESQYKLFGFMWEGKYYYDKNLQMGCSSSCQIFENFSTAIEWIAKNKALIPNIVHILDDFMIVDKTEDGYRWLTSDQLHLFTDASGTYGYGALFGSQWFLGKWDTKWQKQNIAFLELYPIVLAVEIWGHRFENQCIYFHTDNIALVSVINKQTSKDAFIMFLIRRLVLHCLRNNVNFKAKHIYGSKNVLADALSRQQVQKFHRLAPWADTVPKPVPNLPDLPSYRNP